MNEAATTAEYADYRRVKGRKVMQIILEVPIEKAPEIHQIFGEPAFGDKAIYVAIAKLDTDKIIQPVKVKKPLTVSQKCALLCRDELFWRFLERSYDQQYPDRSPIIMTSFVQCAKHLRHSLGIQSRSELDTDHEAAERWNKLLAQYEIWKSE